MDILTSILSSTYFFFFLLNLFSLLFKQNFLDDINPSYYGTKTTSGYPDQTLQNPVVSDQCLQCLLL